MMNEVQRLQDKGEVRTEMNRVHMPYGRNRDTILALYGPTIVNNKSEFPLPHKGKVSVPMERRHL